jgi:hypothetical protein
MKGLLAVGNTPHLGRHRRERPALGCCPLSRSLGLLALLGSLVLLPGAASAAPSQWSVTPSHDVGTFEDALFGVSCAATTDCTAVGRDHPTGQAVDTLLEHWDGAKWSVVPSPNPGLPTSGLNGVSCVPGTDFCQAVGTFDSNGTSAGRDHPLIETREGGTWTVTPNPGDEPAILNGISCVSPSFCVAVGDDINAPPALAPLIETWDGNAWSIDAQGSAAEGTLHGVSCSSATSCIAVGADGDGALVETWDGSSWSVTPVPSGGQDDVLIAVSCADATDCVAVGDGRGASGNLTLVESWNGITWSRVAGPNSALDDSGLRSVSCAGATDCVAVGHADMRTLVETWDGQTWTMNPSPSAGNADNDLTSVSCADTARCLAVGYASVAPGRHHRGRARTVAMALSGSGSGQPPAATPEVPLPLLLPLTGLLVCGVASALRRRRSLR